MSFSGTQYAWSQPAKRQRMAEDAAAVASTGGRSVIQRAERKRKLKSGKIGKKLQLQGTSWILRWQRMYPYGLNTTAYPDSEVAIQRRNPGVVGENNGRLMLSHVTKVDNSSSLRQYMPGYLMDLTTWRNDQGVSANGVASVMKRIEFDSSGNPSFSDVYSQSNTFNCQTTDWVPEKGPTSDAATALKEQKALLAWSDIKLCFYSARKHSTRVHIEMVQFTDEKYQLDFQKSGEPFLSLSSVDQNEVKMFWIHEFKKLIYHPMDTQMYNRKKAIRTLFKETIVLNPDESINLDVSPPTLTRKYFKRFNRLVNFNWRMNAVEINPASDTNGGQLEQNAFEVNQSADLSNYAAPKGRVFLYIRAEDFDPVNGGDKLHVAIPSTVSDVQVTASSSGLSGIVDDIAAAAIPQASSVCGYDWDLIVRTNNNIDGLLLPRFCGPEAYWASDDSVSFDILVRQKWRTQS